MPVEEQAYARCGKGKVWPDLSIEKHIARERAGIPASGLPKITYPPDHDLHVLNDDTAEHDGSEPRPDLLEAMLFPPPPSGLVNLLGAHVVLCAELRELYPYDPLEPDAHPLPAILSRTTGRKAKLGSNDDKKDDSGAPFKFLYRRPKTSGAHKPEHNRTAPDLRPLVRDLSDASDPVAAFRSAFANDGDPKLRALFQAWIVLAAQTGENDADLDFRRQVAGRFVSGIERLYIDKHVAGGKRVGSGRFTVSGMADLIASNAFRGRVEGWGRFRYVDAPHTFPAALKAESRNREMRARKPNPLTRLVEMPPHFLALEQMKEPA
jgi:hypothetical protein